MSEKPSHPTPYSRPLQRRRPMPAVRLAASAVAFFLLGGCGSTGGAGGSGTPVDSLDSVGTVVTGTVRTSGAEAVQLVSLVTDEGRRYALEGDDTALIGRLSGGRIRAFGRSEEGGPPMTDARLMVRSFRLLEMDGQPAYLGRITPRGDGWLLELRDGNESVTLVGPPPRLQSAEGWVWISGRDTGSGLEVTAYGILGG